MGYLVLTNAKGEQEFLGDGVDLEKYKRREGIPTIGKSQAVLDQIDKEGE